MAKYKVSQRRKRSVAFTIWLEADNPDQNEALNILLDFQRVAAEKVPDKSRHEVNIDFFVMSSRALAKNKRPHLLAPREKPDVMLERLANAMYEVQSELAELASKVEAGIVIQASDIGSIASRMNVPGGYGAFEQSIVDEFKTFSEFDGDEG